MEYARGTMGIIQVEQIDIISIIYNQLRMFVPLLLGWIQSDLGIHEWKKHTVKIDIINRQLNIYNIKVIVYQEIIMSEFKDKVLFLGDSICDITFHLQVNF